jgi:hypothetical protein
MAQKDRLFGDFDTLALCLAVRVQLDGFKRVPPARKSRICG